MAEMYKMEADKLKEMMGDYEKEQMKKDIAVQEAVTLIADAANEVLISFAGKERLIMSLVPYVIEQTSRGERSYDIYFPFAERQDYFPGGEKSTMCRPV